MTDTLVIVCDCEDEIEVTVKSLKGTLYASLIQMYKVEYYFMLFYGSVSLLV